MIRHTPRSTLTAPLFPSTTFFRSYGRDDGWVGRLLTLLPAVERDAIAIAPAVPLALRGSVQVGTYAPSRLPQADADLIARLTALYADDPLQIGRASCRERVCQSV